MKLRGREERVTDSTGVVDRTRLVSELIEGVAGTPFADGHRLTLLRSGPKYFPRMLEAIHLARRAVCIEMYALWDGTIGQRLVECLVERVSAGVSVRLIVDAVGSRKLSPASLRTLESGGVDVRIYNRNSLKNIGSWNLRTHRKLILIDSRSAFVGGFNFADMFLGTDAEAAWLDSAVEVEGPVVAQIQRVFENSWGRLGVVGRETSFESAWAGGPARAVVVDSSPAEGKPTVRTMYRNAIDGARRRIWLHNQFFFPDRDLFRSLAAATARGVDVQLIVPGDVCPFPFLRDANRNHYQRLQDAGVRVFEYQPTMLHQKSAVIDGVVSLIGSANVDPRSFYMSEELTLAVEDENFASEMERNFQSDLLVCSAVTASWSSRRWSGRLREFVSGLCEPWL